MKIQITIAALLMMTLCMHAQSPRYENAMRANVAVLDTAKAVGTLQSLSNTFERIAAAEKTQWMPYYYESYCLIMEVYSNKDKTDELADKAEKLAMKADSLSPKNSEIMCLLSMVNSARIMVDPANRGMKYGIVSAGYVQKAQMYDASNPRSYLLQGVSMLYTPAQYGGGKDKAKPLLQTAIAKYATFKPSPDYAPRWGADYAQKMLQQCN